MPIKSGTTTSMETITMDTSAPHGILHCEFLFEVAPFPSCHASTLAEVNGSLVAAWFGGSHEKHPDVGIWAARCEAGRWSAPIEVANGLVSPASRHPCWNPVLFQPREGPLLLFYKVGPSPSRWWGMLRRSDDGGRSWSKPERLPAGILGPVKNKPVQLPGGDIVCPSSTEDGGWRVHFERANAGCTTWQTTGPVNDGRTIGAIQPSLLVHGDTHLQAVGRTQQGRVFTVESWDAGRTWGTMTLLDLPNPDSGTDALTLGDGRFLLVYNHTATGRSPLNVAVSEDGRRWMPVLTLEDTPGEFSYPAVIQTSDGLVHITYTWKRRRIQHVVLDPARLQTPEHPAP